MIRPSNGPHPGPLPEGEGAGAFVYIAPITPPATKRSSSPLPQSGEGLGGFLAKNDSEAYPIAG